MNSIPTLASGATTKGRDLLLKPPTKESRNVSSSFLTHEQQNINRINELLKNIELSPAEERTLLWLCGWESSTVQNICSVIRKIKG